MVRVASSTQRFQVTRECGVWAGRSVGALRTHPRLLCSPSPAPLPATLLPFRSLTPNPDASSMCEKSVGAAIKPQGQLDVWGVCWKFSPNASYPPALNPQPQALALCLFSLPWLADSSSYPPHHVQLQAHLLTCHLLSLAVLLRLHHRRWPSPSPSGYLEGKKGSRWRGW